MIACALACGGDVGLLRDIQNCVTTDAALEAIDQRGLLQPVMATLGARIQATLERWVPVGVEIGFICFTNAEPWKGVLVQSDNANSLSTEWRT